MKKLNIKVVFIQVLGMIFLINGILQLRFFSVAEKVMCARKHFQGQKSEDWNRLFPTKDAVFNFWPNVYIWIFFGLIIGIVLVSFLNWKRKLSSLNSLLVAMILYILLRFKFFRKETVSELFRSVRVAISDDFATQCLIEGIIFTLAGLTILYLSVHPRFLKSQNTAEI
ncbi:hypothetical protein [Flavobacterium sp. 1355]|uniref:hypothetical protein n=1 Tax=Flavobacterium sp. 1355 TaxID=2806571 RepID=UPI001AE5F511|nr:hypothetical protein [Flavobacterium sp. 1355]MBP1224806.1 uncharacterized membrane protein HdeD (DUF308 family) [Flavobacterium sp. 1355]